MSAAPAFAAEPPPAPAPSPAASGSSAAPADPGGAILDRLRRRDPAAALKKYAGRWKRAVRNEENAVPAEPPRLRGRTRAIPVLRRQEENSRAAQRSRLDPPGGLDLDAELEGLDLGDLDLPDDLKLDADDGEGDAAEDREPITPRSRREVREVRDLKGIRDILPFADYDPDPDPSDPCRNLCPRPPGCPPAGEAEGTTAALCPEVRPLSDEVYTPRPVVPVRYRWAASNIAYNPLYFQDVGLERYGHNHGVFQPAVSAGKFAVQLIGLPYQMTLDPPCKCVSPLGYYRPGDCAPKLHYQIPLNARAAVVQAAAVSGIAVIIP